MKLEIFVKNTPKQYYQKFLFAVKCRAGLLILLTVVGTDTFSKLYYHTYNTILNLKKTNKIVVVILKFLVLKFFVFFIARRKLRRANCITYSMSVLTYFPVKQPSYNISMSILPFTQVETIIIQHRYLLLRIFLKSTLCF